ncbi:hypothetical protein B0H17DRAFT_944859 [Mycena rosella]|uniref:Ser-Thr-rich glycosyl-phosphatidyl-inositol-anchored membrane family-domain-containing protein n=1 Tax=Mycena rosella TaxID=1033263 RepID=A0AAD7D3S1_MYCRO|nr:hypothetical protein B0H17DRAFT_944859 [Mycena rosella]
MFSAFTSSGLLFAVLSSLAAVHALCLPCQVGQAPLALNTPSPSAPASRRGVYSPSIIKPDGSTKWVRGTEVNVTWSTSDMPKSITNPHGTILLGHLEPGNPSEHLDLAHPLAEGFNIRDGHRTISVPAVPPRGDYIIVLMGDSGNRSPVFSIE